MHSTNYTDVLICLLRIVAPVSRRFLTKRVLSRKCSMNASLMRPTL
jgi:hypothetical protein